MEDDLMPKKKPVEKVPAEFLEPRRWWLGPLIVFVCMLSATLLAGMIAPAFGAEAVLVDKENLQPVENIRFEILTPEGPLEAENDVITIKLRFTNLAENAVSEKTYVVRFHGREENFTVGDLQTGENEEHEFRFSVKNLGTGIYSFEVLGEEKNPVGGWTLRWGPPKTSDVFSHAITFSTALAVVYLHVTRFEGEKFWPSVGLRRANAFRSLVWVFALWVIFSIALFFYWGGVKSLMGTDPQQEIQKFFKGAPDWYFIYLGFAFFFPVAFTEELIFRGFMIERFAVKGPVIAIALSAFLFTSLHLWYATFGVAAIPLYGGLFILSLLWGIVYWKTRNLFGLIVFHGLFNLGVTVTHFWGEGAGMMLGSAMFVAGVICILYLVFIYLRRLFAEMERLVRKR